MFAVYCTKLGHSVGPLIAHIRMNSLYHRGVRFFFKKNLLMTNSITSGGFMALGDMFQQEFDYQSQLIPKRYDWMRVARMFVVGTVMGPMHHYYYIYLDKLMPQANFVTVIRKILCDQLMASPATILCFFYTMGVLEGRSIKQSTEEVKEKFIYVYMGDCIYWPPIQFINFYFLPTQYRVFYINAATMIFNIFLSFMKHDYRTDLYENKK